MAEASKSQISADAETRDEDLLHRAEQKGEPGASVRLGDLLSRRGDLIEALAAYERGESRGDADAAVRRAELLERLGRASEAEAAFRVAEARGDGGAALGLATMLERLDRADEARRYYEIADQRGDPGGSTALLDFTRRTDPAAESPQGPEAARRESDAAGPTARSGGRADAMSFSPSLKVLERPRKRVTAYELVDRLVRSHEKYGGGRAKGFELGPPEEGAREASFRQWAPEIAALFEPRLEELNGRLMVVGLALLEPPMGRRLLDRGLLSAIEREYQPTILSLLSERGRRLRRALEAAPLAGYVPDTVTGPDQLGIDADVRALAEVVVAKDTEPPLSIGLFGEWGTGKSFFMSRMRDRVVALSERARAASEAEAETPFCQDVVQIEFNAWHYLDANLWASLVARIFEGLASHGEGTPDEPDEEHRALLGRLETSKALLREAERAKDDAEARQESDREALRLLEDQRAQKTGELRALELPNAGAPTQVAPQLNDDIRRLADDAGLRDGAVSVSDLRAFAGDARSFAGRLRLLWRLLVRLPDTKRYFLAVAAAALMGGLAWGIATGFHVGSAIATALSALAILGAVARAGSAVLAPSSAFVDALLKAYERSESGLTEQKTQLSSALAAIDQEVAARRETMLAAEGELGRIEGQIAEIEAGRALPRFIQQRTTSDDYRRHLGLISLVQRDFQQLSTLMRPSGGQAPRDSSLPNIDRIVLYVDDLDRCPSRLVVEVLQAVHLLLAFPLFVVVVGVDSRWLLSSLGRHHAAMLSSETGDAAPPDEGQAEWLSTPQDYLEKIFQIPLRLQPMAPESYRRLVSNLINVERELPPRPRQERDAPVSEREPLATGAELAIADDAVATDHEEEPVEEPARDRLTISGQEMDLIGRVGRMIPTPRAAKRLINTYRFIRAGVPRAEREKFVGGADCVGDYQAVLILLAVMIGFPDESGRLFVLLAEAEQKTWEAFDRQLVDSKPDDRWPELRRCLEELRDATGPDYPIASFQKWAPVVSRFSFRETATMP